MDKLESLIIKYENDAMFFLDAISDESEVPENITSAAHRFLKSRDKVKKESGSDFYNLISDPDLDSYLLDSYEEVCKVWGY